MNYKYAKILEDGTLSYAPKVLKYNHHTYINAPEKIYNAAGYFKIVYSDYPQDGKNYDIRYAQVENTIVQNWVEIEGVEVMPEV